MQNIESKQQIKPQTKNGKNYGFSVYLNLSDDEQKIFTQIMKEQTRTKNNLIAYIVKEYLKEYQAKQSEK